MRSRVCRPARGRDHVRPSNWSRGVRLPRRGIGARRGSEDERQSQCAHACCCTLASDTLRSWTLPCAQALTIEQVVGKRYKLLTDITDGLVAELRGDLRGIPDGWCSDRLGSTLGHVLPSMLQRELREGTLRKSPEWYNEDAHFGRAMSELLAWKTVMSEQGVYATTSDLSSNLLRGEDKRIVMVESVGAGSLGEQAGLLPDDQFISINGQVIASIEALTAIDQASPEQLACKIRRGQQELDLTIQKPSADARLGLGLKITKVPGVTSGYNPPLLGVVGCRVQVNSEGHKGTLLGEVVCEHNHNMPFDVKLDGVDRSENMHSVKLLDLPSRRSAVAAAVRLLKHPDPRLRDAALTAFRSVGAVQQQEWATTLAEYMHMLTSDAHVQHAANALDAIESPFKVAETKTIQWCEHKVATPMLLVYLLAHESAIARDAASRASASWNLRYAMRMRAPCSRFCVS